MKKTGKKKVSRKAESHRQARDHRDNSEQRPAITTQIRQNSGRARPGRRGKVRVLIPAGQQDNHALISAAREWLIPLLIRDFLHERGLEPNSGIDSSQSHPANYAMPWQGARETTRGLNK